MKYLTTAWYPSKKPLSEMTEEERKERKKKDVFKITVDIYRRSRSHGFKFVRVTGQGVKKPFLLHYDELKSMVIAEDALEEARAKSRDC